jgi:hypothetical protein
MTKQILGFVLSAMLFALGGSAQAQQPARILRIGILLPSSASFSFRPGSKHFANGCASLGMSKEKASSLSTDMRKGNSTGCLTLQPNWPVSKWTSSSPPEARLL